MKKKLLALLSLASLLSVYGGEMLNFTVKEAPTYPSFRPDRNILLTSVLPAYIDKLTISFEVNGDEQFFFDGKPITGNSFELSPVDGITDHHFKAGENGEEFTYRVKRYPAIPAWKQLTKDAGFPARDSAGELFFNNKLWIFGGYIPEVIGDVWCSEDGINWTRKPDLPNPGGINIPVEYVFDNAMWIFGEGRPQKLLKSEDGENWTVACEETPMGKRYAASGCVFDGYMWYVGGSTSNNQLKNDVWRSKDGANWECVTEHAQWTPRQSFGGLVAHDGYMWLLGGGKTSYHPFAATSDIWRTKDGKNWECVNEAAPWEGRIWYDAAVFQNRMWLIGGYQCEPSSRNMSDAWYSYDGITWYEFKADPELHLRKDEAGHPEPQPDIILNPHWSSRHEESLIVNGNKLYMVAGNNWPLVNDVWCLEINGMSFVTSPVLDTYEGMRYYYKARADFHASGSPVKYALEGPDFLTINPDTGAVIGTAGAKGKYHVKITATAADGENAIQEYDLFVE